jgi:tight adherence protein C
MLLILAIATIGAAGFFLAEVASSPMRERRNLVHRATNYGQVRTVRGNELPRFTERVLGPMLSKAARLVMRLHPKTTTQAASARLMAAGLRSTSPTAFIGIRGVLGAAGLILGLVLGGLSGGVMALLMPLLFAALGFIGPAFYVSMRASKRQELVSAELPDALDLLAVSVEAGLGFDGAISKLTEHMEGPLIEEFEFTLGEIRIGEGRQEALRKLAERVPAPEMSGFVRAIIQADQLGISLGRILRVQATDTRLKRQAIAEEKAMKAPIKMLFPLVLFIFPAMFIAILGPAFLNLANVFEI